MMKNMFIANIDEIDDSFIGVICEGALSKNRFAEDNFGNFAVIEDDGSIVAYMLDYEKEDYNIAESVEDFYKKYTLYDVDEVYEILNSQRDKKNQDENNHHVFIELYKAKAVVGKDFIDLSFVCDDDQYDATEAYNKGKITEEELNKMSTFLKSYLKDANRVNKEKHNKNHN